jgi:SAM-dependent methyltransferase
MSMMLIWTSKGSQMDHRDHVRLLKAGLPEVKSDPAPVWADFGSGQGAFTLALAELLGPGAQIHSIDQDARALRAQQQALDAGYPDSCVNYHPADFTQRLELPVLDGLVMANALHFIARSRQAEVVRLLKGYLRPQGRMLLVEYNVDRGNLWVPHPLSYPTWEALARECGFASTRLLSTTPSSFLHEFYSALSVV